MNPKTKTKKIRHKLIILSSSSSPKTIKNMSKKRHKLIIESSSTSPENMKTPISKKGPISKSPTSKNDLKIEEKIIENMPERLNEKFIDLMEQLSSLMLKQGEPFRARAYQKAQETIMAYPEDIVNVDQLKGKPGIGSTITEKLNEYVNTGTLKILEREKNNPVNIFTDIYGIGPKKAAELVNNGITTIEQLIEKGPQYLNETQLIGLKYYNDILKRIPRKEIVEYQNIFTKVFHDIPGNQNASFEIVGSFRRGAEESGDIDVIITSNDPKFFKQFIDNLIENKIIIEVLSKGTSKCLVITKLSSSNIARRVDFLFTTKEEYPFSILYFTGSKIFNTVMRHHALTKGLTMNEHGLYKIEGKKKGEKLDHSFTDEKSIFDYLGLVYKEPKQRKDGRDIIEKSKSDETKTPVTVVAASSKKTLKKRPKGYDSEVINKLKPFIQFSPTISSTSGISLDTPPPGPISETISTTSPFVVETTSKKMIDDFKKNGIKVLELLVESQLENILIEANNAYYNNKPLMTDNEFDIIKEYIEKKYPKNKIVLEIGAPVERNKVKLPYFMGSMDKIKPDSEAIHNWKNKYKGPYVLSCKLDGVSGLYVSDNSKLYTRGNGSIGQDISYLIPYLRLPKKKGLVIRGEFIISKEVFEKKYKAEFSNSRNMVAGIINQKKIDDRIKDIDFVSYELIEPVEKPSKQMKILNELDINCVLYKEVPDVNNELLSELLLNWRKNYIYEIDGIIVTDDKIYDRKEGHNPEHSFAFKMVLSDQIAEAKVVDVLWTPSKDGYLKPRVQIEPIYLGGVKIEYATGFNAAFIEDNKIGIGALIQIIRSGDVIPHIKSVTVPAEIAKMPDVSYKWNENHVDILLENIESNETVREKNITGFFRGIGVEGLSSGNIARLIEAGYDSVPKIINMTIDDFMKVEGFKNKMATKLYNGIKEQIENATLVSIMSASNIFGRGFSEKRLELIIGELPNILISNELFEQKVVAVSNIKGMAKKTAANFVEKIGDFIDFLNSSGLSYKLNDTSEKKIFDEKNPLFGKTIVMTGFRDKDLNDKLKEVGASIGSNISKNTFVLLVKNLDEETGKAMDAKELNIPIMNVNDFIIKYFK
jgi:NAD-dependent DNA ligase/Mn-dependent DtxR family transcriptional regulator